MKTIDEINRINKAAMDQLEWAQRKVAELNKNQDAIRATIDELFREVATIKKGVTAWPADWSPPAPPKPHITYQ